MHILEALSYCRERSVELRLDGDRLKLVGNKEAIDDKLLSLVRQHRDALIELLKERAGGLQNLPPQPLDALQRQELQPTSFNQQRLWFMQQLGAQREGANASYNGACSLSLRGRLERRALDAALDALVERHESLRTGFVDVDGTPWQQLKPAAPLRVQVFACAAGEDLDALMRAALAESFDLASDALIRASLYALAEDHHVLLLVTHHITSDAWSQELLLRDFCALYDAFAEGRLPSLPAPALQYIDYACWERERLQGPVLARKLDQWRNYLEGAPRLHSLPCDGSRRAGAARLEMVLSAERCARLVALARAEQTTLFNVMASLFSILLHKLGNESDVVFGMPVANRPHAELEPVAGYFSNTVVLRNRLPDDYDLRQAIALTKANMAFVLTHQDIPFDMLVDALNVERDLSVSPLYQIWFSMHEDKQTSFALHGLEAEARAVERSQGRYDLKLEVNKNEDRLVLTWEYDRGLFQEATTARFAAHFECLLDAMGGAPGLPLSQVAFEDGPVLAGADGPAPDLLPTRWEASWMQGGAETACIGPRTHLSFAQVEQRVRRLAALMGELGAGPGARIGVHVDCSAAALVAVLAVWRIGAVCVPLVAHLGADAVDAVATQAGVSLVLATPGGNAAPRHLELVLLDGLDDDGWLADYADMPSEASAPSPQDHACLLSDGAGQELLLTHRALARHAAAMAHGFGIEPGLRHAYAPVGGGSFFNTSLLLALATGGSLHMLSAACLRDPAAAAAAWREHAVDVLEATPAQYRAWEARGVSPAPRRCLLLAADGHPFAAPAGMAGAECRVAVCHDWQGSGLLCLAQPFAQSDDAGFAAPVLPFDAMLLQGLAQAPSGAWGELVLDCDGQMLRTGIRGRLDGSGALVPAGRFAQRRRRHGFWIDPQRTEAALLALPAVSEAAVLFDARVHDGELFAYVVAVATAEELMVQLRASLPQHLLPKAIVTLDALPLTDAGLPCAASLPAPVLAPSGAAAAASAVERGLQAIWAELLERPQVGLRDNFFDIGGHSLLATRMLNRVRGRIWDGLKLDAIFAHPVLADLARHIEAGNAGAQAAAPIPPRSCGPAARMSYGQQQMWMIDRIEQGSSHYNMVAAYRLAGALDQDALFDCLEMLVERHAALRTRFVEENGEVLQYANDGWTLAAHVEDYTGVASETRDAFVGQRIREEAAYRFDLQHGQLLRVTLIRLCEGDAILVLNIHHIACDGWSIGVLMRELQLVYQARIAGHAALLPPLAIGYADYAQWQRELLAGAVGEEILAFWRRELEGVAPLHGLPIDKPRPVRADHRGAEILTHLAPARHESLRRLAREAGTTLFVCLESLFALFLARLSASTEVVVGTPVSGRSHGDTEPLVGLFANMVALRHRIDFALPVSAYLAAANASVSRALGYQHCPFELVVDTINPERSLAYHPLFQVAFTLKEAEGKRMQLAGIEATRLERDYVESKFDLMLSAVESADGLRLEWQYASALFEAASIEAMAAQFDMLLGAALADPGQAVGTLDMVPEADRAFLLAHGVGPDADDCGGNLYERFSQAALADPAAIALSGDGVRMRYAELAAAAEDIAGHLAGRGVAAGDRVVVYLPRGADLVACLLGIVRLGAAYVPVDHGYPAARIRQIVEDSGARLLVGTEALLAGLEGAVLPMVTLAGLRAVAPAAVAPCARDPERVACLMYTSGSTGAPKGVAVPQRAIQRLVRDGVYMALDRTTVMLQLASPAFDASTLEIWGALLNGGRLAVHADTELDLSRLTDFIEREEVNSMWLTAALFEQWAYRLDRPLPRLRYVLAGGDVVPPAAVHCLYRKLDGVHILNGYGPTENTTFTCCYPIPRDWPADRAIPIGRPIGGTRVQVLDERGQLLPVGAIGELYAGGAGVALAYWGQPVLSAEKFLHDVLGGMRYRTGDLVRWRRDGTLQFLGRADKQVKINGYRIELGEIERCLLGQGGIREVCVAVQPGDQGKLVAYYTPANAGADTGALRDALRRHAREQLPGFMLPAAFVALAVMPVTVNGKLDKNGLPQPAAKDHADSEFVAPQGEMESTLAGIWARLLGLEAVGAIDDFFALGGNSLLAIRMAGALEASSGHSVPVRELFRLRTVRALATWLATQQARPAVAPVAVAGRSGPVAASYAQQRLWFIDRVEGGSRQYNMPALFELEGELDPAVLGQAIDALVERHEVLRTCYRESDGAAVQVIMPAAPVPIACHDLRQLPAAQRAAQAESILLADAGADFDLGRGPVLRVTLVQLEERIHRLLFNMHHIASDGWSVGVLMRDLAAFYQAVREGTAAALVPLAVQYADYASWQRAQLSAARRDALRGYWRTQLSELPQLHGLPLDQPRPARISTRGGVVRTRVAPPLTRALNALAREHGLSLFMLLQSAYALLLARVSGERDIVIGTPVAGRDRPEFESLVGCFVNTLVLRNRIPQQSTLADFLAGSAAMVLDAFEHRDLPFDLLVEDLNPVRSASHLPLFQLWFVLQNMETGRLALPGLAISPLVRDDVTSKFDLMLSATERDGAIDVDWVYNRDLFASDTIRAWADSFQVLLEAMCGAVRDAEVALLPVVDAAQQQALTRRRTSADIPVAERTLYHRFRQAAQEHPQRTALRVRDATLSYGQLARCVERLAGYLAETGVQPGDKVGVCCPRSLEQVIAALAVWHSGAAFVPMDPLAPQERLAFIAGDTGAQLVLASQHAADRFDLSRIDVLVLDGAASDDDWLEAYAGTPDRSDPAALAYVIYTSGTSGRPKGVMVEHASLSNMADGLGMVLRENGIGAPIRWAWNAPLTFDASLQALSQLAVGGELHLLAEEVRTAPLLLLDYLERYAIDLLDCTPSLLEVVLHEARGRKASLPHLLIGGEAINPALWKEIAHVAAQAERVALNVYGPTETTVDATWARIEAGTVPVIGRPLPNVQVRVLDEHLQELPPGAIGECCIGGAGVARGYLNRPELDAERFVTLPAPEGWQRFYRSGDMVRWLPNGELAYLHRRDSQVKLRGYRIELGEIEQVLLRHPAVAEAAVVVSPEAGVLVAYVVGGAAPQDPERLAAHCRLSLPEYMLPAAFVPLASLPLTSSGKLDVRALPAFGLEGAECAAAAVTPSERRVAAIWAGVLEREALPANANFFALGGHSLLAIRVVSAIRTEFGIELPLATFFDSPTIAGLARTLDTMETRPALPGITALAGCERAPLSFAQHRLWLVDRLEGGSAHYNMPAAFELQGRFDADACRRSLALIVERHAVLRTIYAQADGQVVQLVQAPAPVPLTQVDLSGLDLQAQADAVGRILREDATKPFDLGADLMLRAQLLRLADERSLLVFNMHHIASDGWSVNILTREFISAYQAFAAGTVPQLGPLPVQYADYAHWQRSTLAAGHLEAALDYWTRYLQGIPQVHSLPLDHGRPLRQTYNGVNLQRRVAAPVLQALKELAGARNATLFMALQVALAALIGRWSNEEDIVIGTPAAGRGTEGLDGLIGFFLNTLVLRTGLGGNPTYAELLERTRADVAAAFDRQHLPFEMLVDALKPERSLSHPPLFQIMFVLQNQEQTGLALPELSMKPVENAVVMAKFDLLLNANERNGMLELTWNYNSDLFEAATIERMAEAYEQILLAVIERPDTRLLALNLLPAPQARRMLCEWNDTALDLPFEQCLHDPFIAQVKAEPEAVAVIDADGSQSYAELFAHAAALAEHLRPHAAEAEALMAVLLPKGRLQLVATLAIMMAGAAYLPLDTGWPAARIDQVLEHGRARVLLTTARLADALGHDAPRIDVAALAPLDPARARQALAAFRSVQDPDALAYVIFTSGSTGKPKGVAIEHRSAMNTLLDINRRYAVGRQDAVLAVSALSFDLSVYDMFGLLAAGGRVVFPDDAHQKDPEHWAELVERHRISIWDSVPASAELLSAQYEWRGRRGGGALRVLMMSGDWIAPTLPARIGAVFPGVAVHSLGGATEGSVWSISYPIESDMSGSKSVPYGKPLANQRFYVLTADLAACPVGVVGELHIGGIGVAREYYGDPERTAASFIEHPGLGERLYKTGDLGRYMADGNIEFVGRKDSQVKLRGFRIELGDIEAALVRHPDVADAVVMVLDDPTGVQQLVAYVSLAPEARKVGADASTALRQHLAALLPNYMVPAYYIALDAFPLSANNKVDRKRLVAPVWQKDDGLVVEPQGATETLLARVWQEVLGRSRVSVDRNFFELGGSSVHLIAVAGKANLLLGMDIPVVGYFQHPTVRAMAAFVDERQGQGAGQEHEPAQAGARSKSRLAARLAKRGKQ